MKRCPTCRRRLRLKEKQLMIEESMIRGEKYINNLQAENQKLWRAFKYIVEHAREKKYIGRETIKSIRELITEAIKGVKDE